MLKKSILYFSHTIQKLNEHIGKAISWLALLLVLLICLDVFQRYVLSYSTPAIAELEWHLFAILFLIGAAYTLKHDKHVRVDVFYNRFSPKNKALVNIFGTILFLFPFAWIILKASIPYIEASYAINESSTDPGGLPARYLIKSSIFIGFTLLLLQGFSLIINSMLVIWNQED
ncbi:TRAP transporter small permease subunit [Sediminitomix flava]|uniref:TRAP-type mannitol/chloroaromatic compound transport system permease small subunit n=1 Tax=Sediminitomix flava TaxID=379075 RepID=A0A315ZHX4_SEDFL|nr:TRAP transporter small permease subunit [Sediminitomix flava]PWJ44418.1 TRAP-type mannitol/chloroaromatic compound transport system permease small subunit [Sediminitomix flava]